MLVLGVGGGARAGVEVGGKSHAKGYIVLAESIVGLRCAEVEIVVVPAARRIQSPVAVLASILARAPQAWTLCADVDIMLV